VFGLPVGVLGVVAYVGVIACWGIGRMRSPGASRPARAVLLVIAFGGVVFSAYLTFLEPFVIGATCSWCLLSAVAMAVILLLAVRVGREGAPVRGRVTH
jgi:uncharacterized membrane protein